MIERATTGVQAVLDEAVERCRRELLSTAEELTKEGLPKSNADGQLLRPLIAFAGAGRVFARNEALPTGFWPGVLAVQLAHEASLVHDDIIDDSPRRRSAPSEVAERGVAGAVLLGDHLLTQAYRAATATGSLDFARLFARAVERTVAWEGEQGRVVGQVLSRHRYEEIALGKAGELMGCSLATAAALGRNDGSTDEIFELGRRIGLLYQMLDDLLDYCPAAHTGKPPLRDYEQRRWTWPLENAPEIEFGLPVSHVLAVIHGPAGASSPVKRSLNRFEEEAASVRAQISERLPGDTILGALIGGWIGRARAAVADEAGVDRSVERRSRPRAGTAATDILRSRVPPVEGVFRYLDQHSRSFRFACRFFSGAEAARIARVYAFCRVTDDLVDRACEGIAPEVVLDQWEALSRSAYESEITPIPLLNTVMAEMAGEGVPFDYAAELCDGMRMDLRGERYATAAGLRRYTYRVASVVGLWVTRLFGVHEPSVLDRAARMGHAMQLTNILRDVGEDWRRGRLYLPLEVLERHGIALEDLATICDGGAITSAYRAAMEDLLVAAEADYQRGLEALPALPPSLGRSAAVAAYAYRGIHDEIRRRDYDNIRQRAYTRPLRKGWLAIRALAALQLAPSFGTSPQGADGSIAGVAAKP